MLGFGLGLNKWRRVGGGYVGLLDLYPNAAAAYSLRKLRAAYSGSAVRVRKEVSSVSSETDIGFLADGSLDTVSLLSFASDADSGDVFVVTWYDQSLSNDATQSTAANQPKIVSGGSLVTEKGKPALSVDGVNDSMSLTLQLSTPLSLFAVINEDGTNNFPYIFGNSVGSTSDALVLGFIKSSNTVRNFLTGINSYVDASYTGQNLWASIMDSSNSVLGRNGGSGAVTNNATGSSVRTEMKLFQGSATTAVTMKGTAQEFILYSSNQSANRSAIETNINTFYSIYP